MAWSFLEASKNGKQFIILQGIEQLSSFQLWLQIRVLRKLQVWIRHEQDSNNKYWAYTRKIFL